MRPTPLLKANGLSCPSSERRETSMPSISSEFMLGNLIMSITIPPHWVSFGPMMFRLSWLIRAKSIVLGFIADHYGFRATFAVSALLVTFAIIVATKLPETRASHLGQSS